MRSHSKRFKKSLEAAPKTALPVASAVTALKALPPTKFDATVELVMHLGIDPTQADQAMRGAISLPNGIGASRKVIAFCDGADAEKALAAGAIEAGSAELIAKVLGGWMDFDVAVATKGMMKDVSKLGRVLGPQGKMPSPKAGTVVDDITKAVTEYAAGKVEYRNDDGGNLHVPVGKVSFDEKKLVENIEFFIDHVRRTKPSTTKGTYIKKACLTATMSPSVRLEV
ncbi:MAG: 50S ribosomal protein L1 [Planctomycetaceae bacterium]|nr:50S ribosomal protein L1 [Planctomycetaceae bacterium]